MTAFHWALKSRESYFNKVNYHNRIISRPNARFKPTSPNKCEVNVGSNVSFRAISASLLLTTFFLSHDALGHKNWFSIICCSSWTSTRNWTTLPKVISAIFLSSNIKTKIYVSSLYVGGAPNSLRLAEQSAAIYCRYSVESCLLAQKIFGKLNQWSF